MNGADGQMGDEHEITCEQAVALVTDYLEDALTPEDRARFETHLSECTLCTEHFRQIRISISATGRARVNDLSSRTREDLMLLYRRWRDGNAVRPTSPE
jgi:anti-sigma factor RsiW